MHAQGGHRAETALSRKRAWQSDASASKKCIGYDAFGSLLPGRNYSSDSYRFGFNGKENDNEVYGSQGTFQDYGMRMYDTRLGRFPSVDPIAAQYPMLTPYQFASNSPISGVDLDGLEYYYAADGAFLGQGGDPKSMEVRLATAEQVVKDGVESTVFHPSDLAGDGIAGGFLTLHSDHNEFKRLAGVLYSEGSSTVGEAKGIYSVLENRAQLNGTTVSQEATYEKGVYGASEADKINRATTSVWKQRAQFAYAGLIQGILEGDNTGGAYFWDGKDFNGKNAINGGYDQRYTPGFNFTDPSHDLWNQGSNAKSGSTKFGSWTHKYESTGVQGNTTFSRLTDEWRDAQKPGENKADPLGR